MPRRTEDGGPSSRRSTQRAGARPGPAPFAAVDNQIHFHPDPRLGGLAILVLLRRSALRPAGVHLLDGTTHRWWKAAALEDLPPRTWVRLRDAAGRPLPVEVLRASRAMCVRWLGGDGAPVEPTAWDRTRIGAAQSALDDPAARIGRVAGLDLGGRCCRTCPA